MEVRGAERYQDDKLPVLARNLDEQIKGAAKYSLDVGVAVLRLYQLRPEMADKALIARALLRALMEMPRPDYRVLLHLLPDRLVAEEPVSSVVLLAQHLENCRMHDFWVAAGGCKDTIAAVPGFAGAIRAYVLHALGNSYQRLPQHVLSEWTALDGPALQALLAEQAGAGWRVDGDAVIVPLNSFNTAVVRRTREAIRFESVTPVVRHAMVVP